MMSALFVWSNLEPAIAIGLWYLTNVSTVILNKYIFQFLDFKFPLTLTAVHMAICSIGAYIFSILPETTTRLPHQTVDQSLYWTRVLPLATLFCLNIVLGNISLRWIPVSFMQTIKSSVPACTVLFQYLRGERIETLLYLSLVPIVGGVMLATFTEVNFHPIGFWTAALASFVTASIAIVSSMLLTQKLNPVSLLYYMAPASLVILLAPVMFFEVPVILASPQPVFTPATLAVLTFSGALAFLLNVSTFFAIQKTSPLAFTVSGNLKVVLSIVISVMIFHNKITYLNGLGCAAAIAGCFWFSHLRMEANKSAAASATKDGKELLPVIAPVSSDPAVKDSTKM